MPAMPLFAVAKPVIAVIHLLPLPGAPRYGGSMNEVVELALADVGVYSRHGVDGLIVENFRDVPFFAGRLPHETVAALAAITREVVRVASVPVGVNALRNDGEAALAVAVAAGATFIRVNVLMHPVVTEQGLIEGRSAHLLRLRRTLESTVQIFADVAVKHAAPLAGRGLASDAADLEQRGLADALVVSGTRTGAPTSPEDLDVVRGASSLPVYVGSGVTSETVVENLRRADGVIVATDLKRDGRSEGAVDEARVASLMSRAHPGVAPD